MTSSILTKLLSLFLFALLTALYGCTNSPNTLFSSIEYGKAEQVNKLLTQSNVNAENQYGKTPLHIAARRGSKEMAELLIANGARINTADNNGYTPLHEAVVQENKSVVELLIANGADVNFGYETPLHIAARRGSKEMAELLIANGANVNVLKARYETPLYIAARQGNIEMAELLIANGANIYAMDHSGKTALYWAVKENNKLMAELLIANGENINAQDLSGKTALHWAVKLNNKLMAELLIANGSDVNAKDEHNFTPLDFANNQGNKDIAKLLISNGADSYIMSEISKSPVFRIAKQEEEMAAADHDFYVYIGYGKTLYSDAPKSGADGFRFGAGYRFNRYLGVEVGSSNSDFSSGNSESSNFFGSLAGGNESSSFSSSTSILAVVGALPLNDRAEIFGKWGQATTSLSYSSSTTPCLLGFCGQTRSVSSSANQTNTMYGLGIQWRSGLDQNLYYRVQYENFGTVKMNIHRLNQPSTISNIGIVDITFNIFYIL